MVIVHLVLSTSITMMSNRYLVKGRSYNVECAGIFLHSIGYQICKPFTKKMKFTFSLQSYFLLVGDGLIFLTSDWSRVMWDAVLFLNDLIFYPLHICIMLLIFRSHMLLLPI